MRWKGLRTVGGSVWCVLEDKVSDVLIEWLGATHAKWLFGSVNETYFANFASAINNSSAESGSRWIMHAHVQYTPFCEPLLG